MSNHVDLVKKYISQTLSVIPLGADKRPTIKTWKPYQGKIMEEKQVTKYFGENNVGIGIIAGAVSGNLEVIDVDCKYDLTGTLYQDFKSRIGEEVFPKLVVASTPSGGYHLLYRCDKIEGNQKLASRDANDDERGKGEKIKVLIETRGEGGYIAAFPTPGYKFIQNHLHQIPQITSEERDQIFAAARQFNRVFKETQVVFHSRPAEGELGPLEDYNGRADVLGLLVKHGWKITSDNGDEALLRRPGKEDGSHSAAYTRSKKWFLVWSTSTEFESQKAYLPYAVYATLECGGDFSEAARRLRQEGYGSDGPRPTKSVMIKQDVSGYLAPQEEDFKYLYAAREGTIPMGLSTGLPKLDMHYRLKQGNFVVINGHDNTGKTLTILFLAVLSAINHGWRWIIYAGENRSAYLIRKIIELKYCKPITKLSEDELKNGYAWTQQHFTFIGNQELYTYKHILEIGKKLFEKQTFNSMLIDPYNSLSIEMDTFSKLSTHDYHYHATSEFRLFAHEHHCSIYLNCHAVTEALRRTYPKKHEFEGFPMPPNKADTEQGGKFSNRADDFLTIHRLVQHDDLWNVTEIHVRKVKETETGGRPTPLERPVKIKIIHGNCGFEDEDGFNPILQKVPALQIQMHIPQNINPDRFTEPERSLEEIGPDETMPF